MKILKLIGTQRCSTENVIQKRRISKEEMAELLYVPFETLSLVFSSKKYCYIH